MKPKLGDAFKSAREAMGKDDPLVERSDEQPPAPSPPPQLRPKLTPEEAVLEFKRFIARHCNATILIAEGINKLVAPQIPQTSVRPEFFERLMMNFLIEAEKYRLIDKLPVAPVEAWSDKP